MVLEAAGRLRTSLDAIASALANGNIDQLLASEPSLANAVADVHRLSTIEDSNRGTDRDALRTELFRARMSLARCRSLGAAAVDVASATLRAQGHADAYDRSGATPASPSTMKRLLSVRKSL